MEITASSGAKKVKQLMEENFLNPNKVDIFTEDEVAYNATLLRKNASVGGNKIKFIKDENVFGDDLLLESLYIKAR